VSEQAGFRTGVDGTPMPVDVSGDRPARIIWVAFLGGPMTWITHFMVVYLVAEAGCSGDGRGLDAFDPPVPSATTLTATAVAVAVCAGFAVWCHRRWRAAADQGQEAGVTMAFAGFLLAIFSAIAVLFVGLPALVLEC
jgi:hypothetical protein